MEQRKIDGRPKPIPVFYGEAADRIREIDSTPMTEEEKQKIHDTIEWFNDYMKRIIDKNNSLAGSKMEEQLNEKSRR